VDKYEIKIMEPENTIRLMVLWYFQVIFVG